MRQGASILPSHDVVFCFILGLRSLVSNVGTRLARHVGSPTFRDTLSASSIGLFAIPALHVIPEPSPAPALIGTAGSHRCSEV
jgi:hypothetical protein